MARQSHIQITIPDPCSVPWNGMTPVDDDRRHCSSCEKVVTDFSKMSDDELMLYMRHSSGKMCGRFSVEQINRPFQLLPENSAKAKWWRTLFLFPLLIFGKSGKAQVADSVKSSIDSVLVSKAIQTDSTGTKEFNKSDSSNHKVATLKKKKVRRRKDVGIQPTVMFEYKQQYISGCFSPEPYPMEFPFFSYTIWFWDFHKQINNYIGSKNPYSDLAEHKEEPSKPQPALPSNDPLTGILPDEKKYPWKA